MSIEGRIYIKELAERLGRSVTTVRQWMRRADFPSACQPSSEGGRNTAYWTEDQMLAISEYAQTREQNKGWGGFHRSKSPSA